MKRWRLERTIINGWEVECWRRTFRTSNDLFHDMDWRGEGVGGWAEEELELEEVEGGFRMLFRAWKSVEGSEWIMPFSVIILKGAQAGSERKEESVVRRRRDLPDEGGPTRVREVDVCEVSVRRREPRSCTRGGGERSGER